MDWIEACEAADAAPVAAGFAEDLRAAARALWEHGDRTALVALLPDGVPVSPQIAAVVETITGKRLPGHEGRHLFAPPGWRVAACSRTALKRWAMRASECRHVA